MRSKEFSKTAKIQVSKIIKKLDALALGDTPLHVAASLGNVGVVDALLSAGADKTVLDYNGGTYAHSAISNDASVDILKILVEHGNAPQIRGQCCS